MGGTFTNLNYHIVFSTKDRRPYIIPEIGARLYEYIGGVLRGERGVLAQIGGTSDHVHLLVRWRPDVDVSKLLQIVKSHSSGWIHKTFSGSRDFVWQEGYGAFTVSESRCEAVSRYILQQEQHHRRRDFKEEFVVLLRSHGIKYDERYIWA